jgi:hypothetical protein
MIEFAVVGLFTIDFETAFSLKYALRPRKIFITSSVLLCVLCELQAKAEETVEYIG